MSGAAQQQGEQRAALVDAVEASLRPLMPLFLNYGVSHHDLTEMLARVFVTAIGEQLKKEGRPTTVARLALSTGINRSRVEKIVADRDAANSRRAAASQTSFALAQILATWHDDPRFSTPYGVPLDLELKPADGRRSFLDLVGVACPGLDVEVALDQLVAAGCVEVHEQGFLRCTSRCYIPSAVSSTQIAALGESLGALAATIANNLLAERRESAYFERQIETDYPVSEDGRREIQTYIESEGQTFMTSLDRWMSGQHDKLYSPSGKRFGVSMFVYDAVGDSGAISTPAKAMG